MPTSPEVDNVVQREDDVFTALHDVTVARIFTPLFHDFDTRKVSRTTEAKAKKVGVSIRETPTFCRMLSLTKRQLLMSQLFRKELSSNAKRHLRMHLLRLGKPHPSGKRRGSGRRSAWSERAIRRL